MRAGTSRPLAALAVWYARNGEAALVGSMGESEKHNHIFLLFRGSTTPGKPHGVRQNWASTVMRQRVGRSMASKKATDRIRVHATSSGPTIHVRLESRTSDVRTQSTQALAPAEKSISPNGTPSAKAWTLPRKAAAMSTQNLSSAYAAAPIISPPPNKPSFMRGVIVPPSKLKVKKKVPRGFFVIRGGYYYGGVD